MVVKDIETDKEAAIKEDDYAFEEVKDLDIVVGIYVQEAKTDDPVRIPT